MYILITVYLSFRNFSSLFSGGGGANRQHVTTKNTAKLDRETEELKHDQIPLELGKLIQQGRQNKGLSQKDLATVKHNACILLTILLLNKGYVYFFGCIFVNDFYPLYFLQKVNEKAQVINDYEAGRGIPNQMVIGKIERVLGIKLRGKDRGKPLVAPGTKK